MWSTWYPRSTEDMSRAKCNHHIGHHGIGRCVGYLGGLARIAPGPNPGSGAGRDDAATATLRRTLVVGSLLLPAQFPVRPAAAQPAAMLHGPLSRRCAPFHRGCATWPGCARSRTAGHGRGWRVVTPISMGRCLVQCHVLRRANWMEGAAEVARPATLPGASPTRAGAAHRSFPPGAPVLACSFEVKVTWLSIVHPDHGLTP